MSSSSSSSSSSITSSNNNKRSSGVVVVNDDPDENLCTRKALQLSLSPPRCPPHGTAHRSLLVGDKNNNPNSLVVADHHGHLHAHSDYDHHSSIKERIELLIYDAKNAVRHPHLSVGPDLSDKATRLLGTVLSLETQNHFRDSGKFQSISDNIVKYSIPLGAISNPTAALQFIKLTQKCHTIQYGQDKSQFIDVFFPSSSSSQEEVNGMIFFVHGGAWGSGKPWFYRLCAKPFLGELNCAVAIIGYRVYPEGDVNIQVQDLQSAYLKLSEEYPNLVGQKRSNNKDIEFCIMGHSSGAHCAMLMIIEQIKQQLIKMKKKTSRSKDSNKNIMICDSFVGISGPYDISHHFDYEAGRGVEELSPMKAANGYTRQNFRYNSPHLRLKDVLASTSEEESSIDTYFPPSLLLHGIEDGTVPFTATSETAYILRCCGITCIDEFYVPLTGHQDAVVHLMLSGRAERGIIKWLLSRKQKRLEPKYNSSAAAKKHSTGLRSRL